MMDITMPQSVSQSVSKRTIDSYVWEQDKKERTLFLVDKPTKVDCKLSGVRFTKIAAKTGFPPKYVISANNLGAVLRIRVSLRKAPKKLPNWRESLRNFGGTGHHPQIRC